MKKKEEIHWFFFIILIIFSCVSCNNDKEEFEIGNDLVTSSVELSSFDGTYPGYVGK